MDYSGQFQSEFERKEQSRYHPQHPDRTLNNKKVSFMCMRKLLQETKPNKNPPKQEIHVEKTDQKVILGRPSNGR